MTLFVVTVSSQAQVSVNVNIGTPPVWAAAAPAEVQYYYLPDLEVYYDVPARRYIYMRDGGWYRSSSLPARYSGYDLYHGRTVYLTDYRGDRPYVYYNTHKVKYKGNGKWNNPGKHKGHYKGKGNGKGKGHGKGNKH